MPILILYDCNIGILFEIFISSLICVSEKPVVPITIGIFSLEASFANFIDELGIEKSMIKSTENFFGNFSIIKLFFKLLFMSGCLGFSTACKIFIFG